MKILVSGGGTGGHIYPALALIRHLKKQNKSHQFLYIGTANGLEASIVAKEEISFKAIEISGFKRKISLDNIKTILRFLKAVKKSKKYIEDFQPDIVIGTGGYVCGPVVYAAAKKCIPTLIHEQNSVPGLTNKFLAKYVSKIAISFPESAKYFSVDKVVLTGNPRASEVVQYTSSPLKQRIKQLGLDPKKKTVLIVGGSRGAKAINEAVIHGIHLWREKAYQCLYVTGNVHYEKINAQIESESEINNVICVPYIDDMPAILNEVDLLIARAGATTLAEITALGLPSILIPSPYVTNNHQEKNANSLKNVFASKVILENEVTPEGLLKEVDDIIDVEETWAKMRDGALSLGKPNSAVELEGLINQLVFGSE